MIFAQVIKTAMLGVFWYSGRSDRLEQWAFSFLTSVIGLGIYIMLGFGIAFSGWPLLLVAIFTLWIFLAHIALFVRRLHDMNRSGMFMMLPFFSLSTLLVGWLGENGYIGFGQTFIQSYSFWILVAGRSLCVISLTMLASIFAGEGDEGDNDYGEPAL